MAKRNPRVYHTQQVHYLRKTVDFNTTGVATGVLMGTLPAGAQIIDCVVNVVTAFNAGSTNVLTVGTNSTDFNNIMGSSDITEGTPGGYRALTGAGVEFAADADVYIKYTQSGTTADTGQAVVVVAYVPNNDQ